MKKDIEIMKLYLDGAKSFVQLSSAGLALPVVLNSNVLGLFHIPSRFSYFQLTFICISWFCFLVAIVAGVLYQYAAVKFVEYESDSRTYVPFVLKPFVKGLGPGLAYGTMVLAFFGGAVSVVVYSLATILPK